MSSGPSAADVFRILGTARVQHAEGVVIGGALPYATLTYSAAGEDMCLRRMFKKRILAAKPGRYLDIGCAWPMEMSNTYLFYTLGWRGVAVDANAAHAPKWARARPDDRFVLSAVTDQPGEIFLYRNAANEGANRVRGDADAPGGEFVKSEAVPCRRMDAICAEHFPDGDIQLMSMDIEGAEMAALRSNQWDRYRPQVIILECWGMDLHAPLKSEPIAFLVANGYRLDGVILTNAILVDTSAAL